MLRRHLVAARLVHEKRLAEYQAIEQKDPWSDADGPFQKRTLELGSRTRRCCSNGSIRSRGRADAAGSAYTPAVAPLRLAAMALALAGVAVVAGCGRPHVGNNGTFYFEEPGTHGAAVVTQNGGVEFHDRADVPSRVVSHDPNEPWRAPIGFILPKDGKFTQTSKPHVLSTEGLAIILRTSDTRVPSWGGEVLVRVDVIAPAAEGTARWGENVALLVDGDGVDTEILADTALAQLAGRDRVSIFLARGRRRSCRRCPPRTARWSSRR